jgi:hypothetical protein
MNKNGRFIAAGAIPKHLSTRTIKNVSDYRRGQLLDEIGRPDDPNGMTVLGNVIKGFTKKANSGSPLGSFSNPGHYHHNNSSSWMGHGGTSVQVSELYSPLLLHSNLNLPRDRATINAWCRAFFALNPYVHNSISLHSTYPISKINITCKNKKIEDFFNTMIEEIDLFNVLIQIAQEYWTVGEAIVYADMNQSTGKWQSLQIQNPDYVVVQNSVVAGEPLLSLRPDENLKRICTSNKPADIQQRQRLSKSIVEHVRRGENIPLPNFNTTHLARRISPYETRGSGLVVSAFRALMLYDKLRECRFAQSESFINPITLIKVGGTEHKPTVADLEMWKQQFEASAADKDFKIITHNEVAVDIINKGSGIYDTSNIEQALIKEIGVALMTPQIILDGTDLPYSNASVGLDILRQRYMQFRNVLTNWLRRRIFAPVSMANDFYDYVDNKRVLIVPQVDFSHMDLFDTNDFISNLIQLTADNRVPKQVLFHSLGLDYEDVVTMQRQEAIDGVILEKEIEALKAMPLNELRILTSESEISELPPQPVMGEIDASVNPPEGSDSSAPALPGMMPPPPSMPSLPSPPPVGGGKGSGTSASP